MNSCEAFERGVTPAMVKMWVRERFGEEAVEVIGAKLSDETREMFLKPRNNSWYSNSLIRELYQVIDEEYGKGDPNFFRDYGTFDVEQSTKGPLRFLMKMASGKQLIKRAQSFWKHYSKGSRLELTDITENDGHTGATLSLYNWDQGPAGCRQIEGYLLALLPKSGSRNVSIDKLSCIHSGDEHCSWRMNWDE